MTLSEKSAYLKGLMDGLNIDKEKAEGKMIAGIVDLLQDLSAAVTDLKENAIAVSDELDEIEDFLDEVEDFMDEDLDEDDDDYEYMDDDGEDFAYDEDSMYEVTCPKCGEVIELDEETLLNDSIDCPNCGEPLEFEFDEDDEEE